MPGVLSPRDLVSRPDNMGETVLSLLSSGARVYKFHRCVLKMGRVTTKSIVCSNRLCSRCIDSTITFLLKSVQQGS